MVSVWSPTRTTPVRGSPPFAPIATRKLPLPVPVPPAATVIHAASLETVQVQADCVVTLTASSSRSVPTLCVSGDRRYVHDVREPGCSTVTVLPATVIVPRRTSPVFGATVRRTAALPAPSPGTTRL